MEVERAISGEDANNTDILDAMNKLSQMMESEQRNPAFQNQSQLESNNTSPYRERETYQEAAAPQEVSLCTITNSNHYVVLV